MATRDPFWQRWVRPLLSYGIPLASVLAALVITRLIESYFESFRTPLFFCAIMLSTWFCSFMPGMVATLLSVLALKYYHMPPLYSWSFDVRHIPLFVIFGLSALFISWVIAKQQHAERAVRRVRDELEVTVRERTASLRRTNEELQAEIAERIRAEEALRASEERWRAIFENSAVGIALVDSNGRPMAANPALQKMLGYTVDELLTRSLTNLTHEDDLRPTQTAIAELVEGTRQHYDMQKRYRHKDGSVIWVNASGSIVPGSAWFSNEEGTKGEMVPGQLADMAVLSADYFAIPDEEIKRLESVLTIVGGNVVYATDAFATLAPPAPPVSPDWSPVKHYGGYASTRAEHAPGTKVNRRAHAPEPRSDFGHRRVLGPSGLWRLGCDCFAI